MEAYKVSIDFGACNLKAIAFNKDRLTPIELNSNQYSGDHAPNWLYYNKKKTTGDVEIILGEPAKSRALGNSANSISDIKRNLEKQDWRKTIPALDREINLEEAVADIFGAVKRKLPLQKAQEVEAIITVPVNFSAMQIGRLRRGVEKAGIKVLDIISEPFAALFALQAHEGNELVLVFDLGSLTLDLSVARIERIGDKIKVSELAAGGIKFGGADIDNLIYEHVLSETDKSSLIEKEKDRNDENLMRQKIMSLIETAKEKLYGDEDMEEEYLSYDPDISISKTVINKMLAKQNIGQKITDLLDSLFYELQEGEDAYTKNDITQILALGGTMNLPFFAELLENYFGKDKFSAGDYQFDNMEALLEEIENPYMAVAAGAAIYGQFMHSGGVKPEVSGVVPFRIGFMANGRFQSCIDKNSPRGGKFRSLRKLLRIEEIRENGWKLPLYQSFASLANEELVFIQNLELDKSLYRPDEPLMLAFDLTSSGNLRVLTSQKQVFDDEDDSGIVQVEEHIVNLGTVGE